MAFVYYISRQHLDVNGVPLDGGRIYAFVNGTTEKLDTYVDQECTRLHERPILLDSRGNCRVYIKENIAARFELYDSQDNFVESWDGIFCESDVSGKADKVTTAISGHIPSLDNEGNLADSGIASSNVATKTYVDGKYEPKIENMDGRVSNLEDGLDDHMSDTENPHKVTAAQVGAYSKAECDQAISSSVSAHADRTDNPHNVTASQVGAYSKAESNSTFETKEEAISKTETYGLMMRWNGTNTLQFYRPYISIPEPIFTLPITTFNGKSGQIIKSGYRLLQSDSLTSDVNLNDWTLFVYVLSNSAQYLYEDGGYYNGTTTYYNIQCSLSSIFNDGYNNIVNNSIGKVAIRRRIGNTYIQYSTNGLNWNDVAKLEISRFGRRDIRMLTFGGNASGENLGKGIISAKLWNQSLDNISSLF